MDLTSLFGRCPLVAILRGIQPAQAESIGFALERNGITVIEVPLNSPRPFESIGILARTFGDRVLIGAGTVTKPSEIDQVAAAGGRLIVSPHADTALVRRAKEAGLVSMPGFFNPTEAFALLDAGADAIKLFPAEVLGTAMLKALRAVLPKAAMVIPVGGIDATNAASWIEVGAQGLGVGSSIYKPGDDAGIVDRKAQALVAATLKSQSTSNHV